MEVTANEQKAIEEAAEQFMEDNSKKALRQLGATKEYVKEMLRLNTIQAKMRQAMDAEVDTDSSVVITLLTSPSFNLFAASITLSSKA